jgi:DNA primase small subunit
MEEQTRAYLSARFGDHYGASPPGAPPDGERREWGYIPFSPGSTTMVRHQSLLTMGELGEFLGRQAPRHVYYSAAHYDDPDAGSMDAKGWRGADLVFDLDADHLPGVDPGAATLGEMLEECKGALRRLLALLEEDFGFRDREVVFSGGRGYHVHVRDERVLELGRDQRREIVDYVLGTDVDFEAVVRTEAVSGDVGRETPAPKKSLPTDGGWGGRVHEALVSEVDRLLAMDEDGAREELTAIEGIGEGKAGAILGAAENNYEEIAAGNVDVHGAFLSLGKAVAARTVASEHAPIDEPVTTDVNRLIRLPGSLHGGSGLQVTPVERGELDAFDPFVHAVPDTFRGEEVVVDVHDGGVTPFPAPSGDGRFTVEAGVTSVPEHVGLFLMARGRAEKGKR